MNPTTCIILQELFELTAFNMCFTMCEYILYYDIKEYAIAASGAHF